MVALGARSERDDRSFTDFTCIHYADLFRTAALLTGDAVTAEELVQDTLAELYPVWWRVDASERPVSYVRRRLTRTYLANHRRIPGDMLADLNHRQRAAIVMRYAYDLDDAELAACLGCRPTRARGLVSRGLATIRKPRDLEPGLARGGR